MRITLTGAHLACSVSSSSIFLNSMGSVLLCYDDCFIQEPGHGRYI